MIAALVAAALLLAQADLPTAPPDVPPLRHTADPATVLDRYQKALTTHASPSVLTFTYAVEQTGARDLSQVHQVFRSGTNERDEIVAVDGHKLDAPVVRIAHGKRNRYTFEALAPTVADYAFRYVGPLRAGRVDAYVFATTPRVPGAFRVTRVTIDGATFLPQTIAFVTDARAGSGAIAFMRADAYWVPAVVTATGTYAKLATRERITFSQYRFPKSLPPGTFSVPHALPIEQSAGP